MPVIEFSHDLDALRISITAQFPAPVRRIWEVYADPRQLEKVWGPPGYPATFVDHSLRAGGRMNYYMTGPEGERYPGYWQVEEVEAPHRVRFLDGFAHEDFTVNTDLPTSKNEYSFEEDGSGTRAVYVSTYASREDLQQVLDMGIEEGATQAIGQIDNLVA